MGRCNNRRAQQRAAEERNVPSRARFSKGPPSKKGGRGGRGRGMGDPGRGGRGGGRGGRGNANNDAVVQKIQNRVQQQRKDLGGISIVKTSANKSTGDTNANNINSISRKSKQERALDGIDINKLDTITLSVESVAIVERLLRAYNVWEEGDDLSDEKKSGDHNEKKNADTYEDDGDRKNEVQVASSAMETDQISNIQQAKHDFEIDQSDENYDDYGGDYDDEPADQCRNDGITFNHMDTTNGDDYEYDSTSDESDSNSIDEDVLMKDDEDDLINSPIFMHLTQHFSFQQQEVILALRASHKRLRIAKLKAAEEEEAEDDNDKDVNEITKEDEGSLLEMSMDWLSLHLKESDLRKGFRVQKIDKPGILGRLNNPSSAGRTFSHEASFIKAVPHESLSIMPKLTQSQYEKETKETLVQLRKQNLMTDLIRMGFHSSEVDKVLNLVKIDEFLESSPANDDDDQLQPLSILNGELLKHLVACVEYTENGSIDKSALDEEVAQELEETTIIERDQEKEVLEAIYAEGFRLLSNESTNETEDLHYSIEVNPTTALTHPACNDTCHLHVITRRGYPLTSTPLLWFTNASLPPTLLRRISIKMKTKANELVGQAAVFDLMEHLAENVYSWQQEFIAEEKLVEEKIINDNTTENDDDDDDEIDYYTTHFTVEEIKKLSRRQRQKYKAAQKSHAHDDKVLEKQRLKEQKEKERQERTRIENETVQSRMAEKVVNRRWDEWVDEEAEKAARKAMNDAFLRGEDRDQAREAAEAARKEMLRFHGVLEEGDSEKDLNEAQESGDCIPAGKEDGAEELNQELHKPTTKAMATPKTLLFVEKLRRMYEEKAREKAAGAGDDENNNKLRGLHLSEASQATPADDKGPSINHIPAPVVAPSPGVEDLLDDVLKTQREQPWLIASEARVVSTIENHPNNGPTPDDNRKNQLSNSMRVELERKYQVDNATQHGKGRQGRGNDRRRSGGVSSNQQFQKMLQQREKLPAYKMREQLLTTIHQSQITVISGDTGCGKTTQVPQLVLDDLILNNKGAEANIIVTQPRRISAIGVSERIAAERCEKIGQTVGYSIRLESKRSHKTRLLLCTTGVLLRRLQCDPDLASVSHIFVDEVHERDLNTDFLLIILKDLLLRRPSLKLVLMSATLNAERFSEYFGGCPVVSIPGRAQPVQEYRLEDALQMTGHLVLEGSDCAKKPSTRGDNDNNDRMSKTALRRLYPNYSKNVIDSLSVVDEAITNYELIAELLQYICLNLEEGAILVFLSGMKEITTAVENLSKLPFFQNSSNSVIYPLHSSLSNKEQTIIFNKPPPGKRKIVLSTNIAETSITIDDVVFVIDAGRVKENRYDDFNKMPTLTECWASKAATKQRRGRAGRVKPGYCWHLYSTHTHDKVLDDYQLPEINRVGLEDLVLQILVLDLGEPSQFLTKAVDPPSDLSIKNALQLLESLGAAECEWDSDESAGMQVTTSLTALGYHLATLPVHPRQGKLLIYGALFGCFEEVLTIAAAMTSRSPFVSSFDNRDAADEAKRTFAGDDHVAVLLAFNKWMELKRKDGRKAKSFLQENYLSFMALSNIVQLKKQLEKYMQDIGFASPSQRGSVNSQNEANLHLVRAVVAAGLYPNIVIALKAISSTAGEVALRGQKVREIYLHPSTIAFTAKEIQRYGCYNDIVKTSKVYIRDFTPVSKFSILLFGGSLKVYQTKGLVVVDDWLRFRVDAKPATLVKYLRSSMEALLLEKIMDPSIDTAESPKGRAVIDAVASLLTMEGGK